MNEKTYFKNIGYQDGIFFSLRYAHPPEKKPLVTLFIVLVKEFDKLLAIVISLVMNEKFHHKIIYKNRIKAGISYHKN